MPRRPRLDQAVLLEQDGTASTSAVVTGYDDTGALLRPLDAAAPLPTAESTAGMAWSSEDGPFRCEVRVTRQGDLWHARFIGEAQQVQRRAFHRVPVGTPMTLTRGNRSYKGVLVDVSDVALRARFDADQTPAMREGDRVHASFDLGDSGFVLHGGVVREQITASPHFVDVIVAFAEHTQDGDGTADLTRAIAAEKRGQDPR